LLKSGTAKSALPADRPGAFAALAVAFSTYRNIRVNPKFSVTAKPETITQLLQIMQLASA
jgi:hypothetical protein